MILTNLANLLLDGLLSVTYPQSCVLCTASVEDRRLGVVCAGCWSKTQIFTRDDIVCWKCGALSRGTIENDKREEVNCRRCNELAFTAARSSGEYSGALRATVLELKKEPYLPSHLVDLLAETQKQKPLTRATRVIPVPLHPERQKNRGFNQAAIIGEELARIARLPFDQVSLKRSTHSELYRAGMDAKGRSDTVEGAFTVRYPRLIENESCLLVDDVFTTGATVSSCAKSLLSAGAKEVLVLTIARSSRH